MCGSGPKQSANTSRGASCAPTRSRSSSVRKLDFQVEEQAFQSVARNSEHYRDLLYNIPQHIIKSKIFSFADFTDIWKCLPHYVQTRKPVKVFESAEDGFNLPTFYSKAKSFIEDNKDAKKDLFDYHYYLILIHTTSDSKFGAFVSAFPCFDPRNPFVGTSDSFVFSLAPKIQNVSDRPSLKQTNTTWNATPITSQ